MNLYFIVPFSHLFRQYVQNGCGKGYAKFGDDASARFRVVAK